MWCRYKNVMLMVMILVWIDVAPDAMTTKAPATWPYFEAQSHGFCTRCLRFVPPLLTTTQDSLPVGG